MRIPLRFAGAFAFASALILAGALVARANGIVGQPKTTQVAAGGASRDQAVQADLYFPGAITIDEGDSITWSIMPGAAEAHTVTFGTTGPCVDPNQTGVPVPGRSWSGTGCVSSGTILPSMAPAGAGPKTFTLTFPKAGTYKYFCQFHVPAMVATVVVQPAGSPYPTAQASYVATSDPVLAQAVKSGQAALAAQSVTTARNANGTTTYTMNAGYGDGKSYGLYRFGASNLTIHTGDTVTWVQRDPDDAHTVTFLNNGQDVPFTLANGAPNPVAFARTPQRSYDGTGLVNSGLLPPAAAPAPARTYSLTFTRPGSFKYVCLIHDDFGMVGSIQVLAATPAAMPNTGGAPGPVRDALGLLGLALVSGGAVLYRRSASTGTGAGEVRN
jgi:plastocyanin